MVNWRKIESCESAKSWIEGFPVGTGRLAGMLTGTSDSDVLGLNHECLWTRLSCSKKSADSAGYLPGLRALLAEEKPEEAMQYLMKYFKPDLPANELKVDSYQPAGEIVFRLKKAPSPTSDYTRELDLETGIATVVSHGVRRRVFGNHAADRLAGELSSEEPFALEIELTRLCAKDQPGCEPHLSLEDNALCLTGRVPGDVHYCVVFRFATDPGADSAPLQDGICLSNVKSLFYEVNIGCGLTAEEASAEARFALSDSFETMLSERTDTYNRCRNSLAEIDIPSGGEGLLAFNYAKHLYLSGALTGRYPLNLQGKWNASPNPPWGSDYHLNINLQMNYWAALPMGLTEANRAMLDFFLERGIKPGQEAAKSMFGCRGVWFSWEYDPACIPVYGGGRWGIWGFAALWLAQHYYAQYEYTEDKAYLQTHIYPYLRECAHFLEDFVTYKADGRICISPSQSPENTYRGAERYPVGLCETSTIDIELSAELLDSVIAASEILDVDAEERVAWKLLRSRLPELKIGDDGRLLEWGERAYEEVEPGHRHISHLYAVWPGHGIDRDLTPELYAAARKSLDYRLASGGGHTGWSRAWCACFKAAFRDGDGALKELEELVERQCSSSLLDLHPHGNGTVFQIDGNFGAAAAVFAMLLRCENGTLEFLPALPEKWKPEGKVKRLRAKGGYTLDFSWKNGKINSLTLEAGRTGSCTLLLNGERRSVNLSSGKTVSLLVVQGA